MTVFSRLLMLQVATANNLRGLEDLDPSVHSVIDGVDETGKGELQGDELPSETSGEDVSTTTVSSNAGWQSFVDAVHEHTDSSVEEDPSVTTEAKDGSGVPQEVTEAVTDKPLLDVTEAVTDKPLLDVTEAVTDKPLLDEASSNAEATTVVPITVTSAQEGAEVSPCAGEDIDTDDVQEPEGEGETKWMFGWCLDATTDPDTYKQAHLLPWGTEEEYTEEKCAKKCKEVPGGYTACEFHPTVERDNYILYTATCEYYTTPIKYVQTLPDCWKVDSWKCKINVVAATSTTEAPTTSTTEAPNEKAESSENKPAGCNDNQYKCADGECVTPDSFFNDDIDSLRCNDWDDCNDGSDELNCATSTTAAPITSTATAPTTSTTEAPTTSTAAAPTTSTTEAPNK